MDDNHDPQSHDMPDEIHLSNQEVAILKGKLHTIVLAYGHDDMTIKSVDDLSNEFLDAILHWTPSDDASKTIRGE